MPTAFVELDAIFHQPDWTELPDDEFQARVRDATAGEGWVVDGNYRSRIGALVLEQADTLVWLDLPLRVCLRRIWRRTWRRIFAREELWDSRNRETIRNALLARESLLVWAIKTHFRHRRDMLEWIAHHPHLHVVHLRSRWDVERWLADHSPSQ